MTKTPVNKKSLKIELYSVQDVAHALGVHPKTIRRAVASGRLLCLRAGRQIRFTEAQVQVFLASHDK